MKCFRHYIYIIICPTFLVPHWKGFPIQKGALHWKHKMPVRVHSCQISKVNILILRSQELDLEPKLHLYQILIHYM